MAETIYDKNYPPAKRRELFLEAAGNRNGKMTVLLDEKNEKYRLYGSGRLHLGQIEEDAYLAVTKGGVAYLAKGEEVFRRASDPFAEKYGAYSAGCFDPAAFAGDGKETLEEDLEKLKEHVTKVTEDRYGSLEAQSAYVAPVFPERTAAPVLKTIATPFGITDHVLCPVCGTAFDVLWYNGTKHPASCPCCASSISDKTDIFSFSEVWFSVCSLTGELVMSVFHMDIGREEGVPPYPMPVPVSRTYFSDSRARKFLPDGNGGWVRVLKTKNAKGLHAFPYKESRYVRFLQGSDEISDLAERTSLKRAGYDSYIRTASGERLSPFGYLRNLKDSPCVEQLVKAGYGNAAADVLRYGTSHLADAEGKSPREIFGADKSTVRAIRDEGMSVFDAQDYILLKGMSNRFTKDSWDDVCSLFKDPENAYDDKISEFVSFVCDGSLDAARVLSVIKHCSIPAKDALNVYTAYLPIARVLRTGTDYTDKVEYPDDLSHAYEELRDEYELHMATDDLREFLLRVRDARKYEYTELGSPWMIKAPKTPKDLTREGDQLHHCVGTFIKSVQKGDSVILFLRKTDEPDKPFFTIELVNGAVHQVHGSCNADVTDSEMHAFLERFFAAKGIRSSGDYSGVYGPRR